MAVSQPPCEVWGLEATSGHAGSLSELMGRRVTCQGYSGAPRGTKPEAGRGDTGRSCWSMLCSSALIEVVRVISPS